ncbi:hypothetical protein AB0F03_36560 [Streptomyces sp. NPDC028722]|uniref:hypothetical protein n=1 Tax=unclassified Streptomyces TaxID=2593676 RepID=UPI0034092606
MTWVGPVQWDGQHAPIYLCESCLIAVERRAHLHFLGHRPDLTPPATVARPHYPALPPERTPMQTQQDPQIQLVSISLSGFGIRATAGGRTGLDAWRIIRRRYPRVALAAAGYVLLLAGGLIAVVAARLGA